MASSAVMIDVEGQEVRLSSPDKVIFSARSETKLDLVNYYLAVGAGALLGVHQRPFVMKRFPHGAEGDFFFQKRVPENRPDWLRTVRVAFPSGRTAEELCPANLAHIIWAVNLGCLDLNPWAVRRWDLEHPDELRIDLDPQPGNTFEDVREMAALVHEVLTEHNLVSFPKTSGSRGIHINIRIAAKWDFTEVRRAALALAREVERRRPDLATSKWWKEERGQRILLDYNQNARDRTVASAYSVRPSPEAMVSAPFEWSELPDIELQDFTIATMPERYAERGDLGAAIDERAFSIDSLLELAAKDERDGLGDEAWPPNFPKAKGEPRRVAPSRRKAAKAEPAKAEPDETTPKD